MRRLVSLLRALAVLPIRLYQRFVSRYTPPTCRFRPTCSEYGVVAIQRQGVFKGGLLLAWRILRCQPFSEPGPDPVPPPGRWRPTSGVRVQAPAAAGGAAEPSAAARDRGAGDSPPGEDAPP